jgi:hypothetical protein
VRAVLLKPFLFSGPATRPQSEAPRAPDRLVSAVTCLRCKEATYRPLTDWRTDSLASKGGLLSCRGGSVESKGSRKPPCRPEVERSRGWVVVSYLSSHTETSCRGHPAPTSVHSVRVRHTH